MEQLLAYLNSLSPLDQAAFAQRCNTTIGYLRKAISKRQRLSEGLCLRLAAESRGAVTPEAVLPDVDWQQLQRGFGAASAGTPATAAGVA